MWCTALLVVLSFTCTIFARDLPQGWPSCKRNDPNLSACLLTATETMRDILITRGAKEFGFPLLGSFVLPEVKVQQNINSNINVDLTSTNVSIKGLETYKFTEISYDTTALQWLAKIEFDFLNLTSGIEFKGTIFGNNVEEKGDGTFSIRNPKTEFVLNGKLKSKKGKDYYHIENAKVKLTLDPKSVVINDVNGISPGIIKTINDVLADESGANLKAIINAAEEVVGNIVKTLIENIHDKVPYDKLFPL